MKTLARRRARELALKVLYSLDANPELDAGTALTTYYDRFAPAPGQDDDAEDGGEPAGTQDRQGASQGSGRAADDAGPPPAETVDRVYAEILVREVSRLRPELDELLTQVSRNWRIERMARVERTILRMAVFELKHRHDVPPPVAISEAIELAKRFGAADAPAFVNGLLDSALQALGPGPGAGPGK